MLAKTNCPTHPGHLWKFIKGKTAEFHSTLWLKAISPAIFEPYSPALAKKKRDHLMWSRSSYRVGVAVFPRLGR